MAVIRPKIEMKDSGDVYIGKIPLNWRLASYKYFTDSGMGLTILKEDVTDLGVPIYSATQDSSIFGYINNTKLKLGKGDLVIPARGNSIGCTTYVEDDVATCTQTTIYSKVSGINPKFLFYCSIGLKEEWFYYVKTAIPQITVSQVQNNKVPLPPLFEQQAIADYLDEFCSKIDEIISEAKSSIDAYKELRIAAVNDAVTHGIRNNAVKDSNVDWIGKIPDNWKIIITKRLFKIRKEIAGKEGYTVLSITQKGIVPKVFGGKGQFAADYSNYQIVNKGDFAMNHMDLLTGWLDISDYDGVTSPDYRVFVPTGYEDIYAPYYKYVMQNCYSCRIYYGLGHGVAGMGRWRLPADMFLNFKLPMPPKAEQREIADFLDKRTVEIDSLITEKEALINDLEAYKKSLIYEVVTGKRRVV